MLNPNSRSLYTGALTPPPGMVFDEAIATTFSLDPITLLTIPIHLALLGKGNLKEQLDDGITLLEALRRVTARMTVYAQRGRMLAPDSPHVLYGLLESMVIDVLAPRRGVFHPKLWLLRFVDPLGEEAPLLRLLILSRNLTLDRSWDLSLQLEGQPGRRFRSENRELAELIAFLPELAKNSVPPERRDQTARLSDEARRTQWELPPGFESVKFHVFGRKRKAWLPPQSRRLLVVSPFCTDGALEMLCQSTDIPEALISRSETLAELSPNTRAKFKQCLVLDDAAETEDGEDQETAPRDISGLHAKAYIFQQGWNTHLFIGSANATTAALRTSENIEVLVELVGKRSQVGGIDELLSPNGLGEFLAEYGEPASQKESDAARKAAEDALEKARQALIAASLHVVCSPGKDENGWRLHLVASELFALGGVSMVRAWPLTVTQERALDLKSLFQIRENFLGTFSPQAITGLIAFELISDLPDIKLRFALNLPVEGLPAERDAAIIRTVIRNRDGFLRYLLLLLSEFEDVVLPALLSGGGSGNRNGGWKSGSFNSMPLLEELTRAYSRNPERLLEVKELVNRLSGQQQDGEALVPLEFLELWQIFEAALKNQNAR
jgi:hypothetical protein